MNNKRKVAEVIREQLDINLSIIEGLIEIPPREDMGDYAFPCFQLAKDFRKSPEIIAKELSKNIRKSDFKEVQNLGAYVNFFIDKSELVKSTLEKVLLEGNDYGKSNIGKGKKIYLKYSQSNINNSFQMKDLFSIIIGNSLYNLFSIEGYKVEVANKLLNFNINDCELIFSREGLRSNKFLDKDIEADVLNYDLINKLKEKNILCNIDDLQIVMLNEYNMAPCIILDENNKVSYEAKDLSDIISIKELYNFDKYICVFESSKTYYFKKVFKVLELLGFNWVNNCVHARYGLFKFQNKSCFINKNSENLLENIINQLTKKILKNMNEKKIKIENKETVAKRLANESLIFTCLKNPREKGVLFDLEKVVSFNEGTILYVQYVYSMANCILEESKNINERLSFSNLSNNELHLVKLLKDFNSVINKAMEALEPCIIANYTINITKYLKGVCDSYYSLNLGDRDLLKVKLILIKATCQVIKNSLNLIGIKAMKNLIF